MTVFKVRWHPFMLDPTLPNEGVSREAWLGKKFGDARVPALHAQMTKIFADEGVSYAQKSILGNTLNSHRLIRYSFDSTNGEYKVHNSVVNEILLGYHSGGKNITDINVLAAAAKRGGLDAEKVIAFLKSDESSKEVLDEIKV
ncbi:hypothetical protein HK096_002854, partial [Nowakowskiella sp. JEL0078]